MCTAWARDKYPSMTPPPPIGQPEVRDGWLFPLLIVSIAKRIFFSQSNAQLALAIGLKLKYGVTIVNQTLDR